MRIWFWHYGQLQYTEDYDSKAQAEIEIKGSVIGTDEQTRAHLERTLGDVVLSTDPAAVEFFQRCLDFVTAAQLEEIAVEELELEAIEQAEAERLSVFDSPTALEP